MEVLFLTMFSLGEGLLNVDEIFSSFYTAV